MGEGQIINHNATIFIDFLSFLFFYFLSFLFIVMEQIIFISQSFFFAEEEEWFHGLLVLGGVSGDLPN